MVRFLLYLALGVEFHFNQTPADGVGCRLNQLLLGHG